METTIALGRAGSRRLGARLAAALALLCAILAFALPSLAFTPPRLEGHVVDTAGKLGADDVAYLDGKLDAIRRRTGFEIVAFVPGSLEGEPIDDVAYTSFNAWGLGRKGADNGVLLVIAPTERKVRIETGKGVGGALTDLQSNDIIRQKIAPLLQQERFRDAIDQGTAAIAAELVKGTPEAQQRRPRAHRTAEPMSPVKLIGGGIALLLVIFLAIVSPAFRSFLWLLLFFGGRGGGGGGGGLGGGSGYSGGGGRSGGGGSSDDY
jgi:uncharacterized protein